MHSTIGQNIKSLDVSDVRCPVSGVLSECEKNSNGHNSATRHPIDFVFGSGLAFLALFNLTAHELGPTWTLIDIDPSVYRKKCRLFVGYYANAICVPGSPSRRKDCGYPGIPEAECLSRDCCWDDSIAGVKWCFDKSKIVPLNKAWVLVYSVDSLEDVVINKSH